MSCNVNSNLCHKNLHLETWTDLNRKYCPAFVSANLKVSLDFRVCVLLTKTVIISYKYCQLYFNVNSDYRIKLMTKATLKSKLWCR